MCQIYKISLFCPLRIDILPLEIETSLHDQLKLEDRICNICKESFEDTFPNYIFPAYYGSLDINCCNNYINQFIEAIVVKNQSMYRFLK